MGPQPLIRALLGASLLLAATGSSALADGPPQPVSLDGSGWQRHLDPRDRGLAAGWNAAGPTQGWAPTSVPSTIDPRPIAPLFRGTVAWYRLRFQAPRMTPGYTWALHFDQVRRRAVVWLNGVRLGANTNPYGAFELHAHGLRPGVNELVVRVDNRKGVRPREGWWNWGGIVRPVSLVPEGRLVMRDLALLPRVDCAAERCDASVRVVGIVRNRMSRPLGGRIKVELTAPDGTTTSARFTVPRLRGGRTYVLHEPIAVAGPPALWSPRSPQLYDADVTLSAAGRVEQTDHSRIGLRSMRVVDGHFQLNGSPMPLYGASIQEDVPGRGDALTPADDAAIVAQLQDLGANVTRAHYPLSDDLLSKLDAAGIMVWSEAPVYHQNRELKRPAGRAAALAMVRSTVLAGRNHPSVVVNSVANEPVSRPDANPGTRSWLAAAVALTRRLDPTRPVAVDILSYPFLPYQRTYRLFDALGINNYYGWYLGNARHPTGNFADLEPYLQKMHGRYPRAAMVMTEYGAEATADGPSDRKGTYEFQSDYIRRVLDVVRRNTFMGGAIYWTLREFAVKPDWLGGIDPALDPQPDGIHNKGLISYDGVPKPAFDVLKDLIAQAPGS